MEKQEPKKNGNPGVEQAPSPAPLKPGSPVLHSQGKQVYSTGIVVVPLEIGVLDPAGITEIENVTQLPEPQTG